MSAAGASPSLPGDIAERYERLRASVLEASWAPCSEPAAVLGSGMRAWMQQVAEPFGRANRPTPLGRPASHLATEQAGLAGLITDMIIASAQQGASA
jgi:hypothetical protein